MPKPCKPDQIRNPASGRCVSKTGAIGKKLIAGNKTPVKPKTVVKRVVPQVIPKTTNECPPNKIRNPASGRCVSKSGAIGKRLLAATQITPKPTTILEPKNKQLVLSESNKQDIDGFKKILNLKRKNPVDFICYSSVSNLIYLQILKKYKSDCHYLGGMTLGIYGNETAYFKKSFRGIFLKYEQCAKNKKVLCIPVNPLINHRNMLILNPFVKKIELFEPHGNPSSEVMNVLKNLERYIRKNGTIAESKNITLDDVFSLNACPYGKAFGIQAYDGTGKQEEEYYEFNNRLVKDPGGFCCMWSFLMMEFRLLYPTKTSKEFSELLTNRYKQNQPELWREFIRGYTYGFTEELLRELNKQLPGLKIKDMRDIKQKYHWEILTLIGKMKNEI